MICVIEELKGEYILGYACVVTTTIKKRGLSQEEYVNSLKQTKAYEIASHMFSPDLIRIDVITGSYRKRKVLLEYIDTFKKSSIRKNPIGCIAIPSILDLGTSVKEIKKNYLMLCENDIGIMVLNDESLGTVGYDWEYSKTSDEIRALLENLSEDMIPTRQGRKKKELKVTDEFKQCYWYFENYFIPESIIYKNNLINVTKVAFNQLCDLYEHSNEYEQDELEQDVINAIGQKPKRHGKVTDDIEQAIISVQNGSVTIDEACRKLHLTPITFQRYQLKGKGRSSMGKATLQFRDESLIEKITMK